MRIVLLSLAVALASCAGSGGYDEDALNACYAISDRATRQACLRQLIADDQAREDNYGIGPPSCHPLSTSPNPDRDRC